MALVCSPYSASSAKPSRPASELSETTGKTTLMLLSVTPRLEVLAVLTGDGDAAVVGPVDAVVDGVVEGALAVQAAVPTRTNPATVNIRIRRDRGCSRSAR